MEKGCTDCKFLLQRFSLLEEQISALSGKIELLIRRSEEANVGTRPSKKNNEEISEEKGGAHRIERSFSATIGPDDDEKDSDQDPPLEINAISMSRLHVTGTEDDDDDFINDTAKRPRCVIDPKSVPRRTWDTFILLPCLIVLAITLPFSIAFKINPTGGLLILNQLIDVIFIVDILLNLRTGYVTPTGTVEYSPLKVRIIYRISHTEPKSWCPTQIFIRYARTWLLIDLASGFPFDLINLNAQGTDTAKVSRVTRFLKLTRFLKTSKVRPHYVHLENNS